MSRPLTKEDILNSQSVHLYTENVIYVELEDDEVYGFNKGGSKWYKKENFYDYFDSSLMMSYFFVVRLICAPYCPQSFS